MRQKFGSFQALYQLDLTVYAGEPVAHLGKLRKRRRPRRKTIPD
jgi:hypothetical protein